MTRYKSSGKVTFRVRTKSFLILTLSVSIILSAPVKAEHPESAVFGSSKRPAFSVAVVPFYGPEKIYKLYTPLIEYLNRTTRFRWELTLSHNHESIIEGICSGEIDIALLGPVPLGRVYHKCGAEPVLVSLGSDGMPFYRSVIISTEEGVKDILELRGKKVGFFRGSTAAHIVPAKMLKDAGLKKADITVLFYENQESIVKAVLKKEVDAGGIKESLYRKVRSSGLKVIKISGPLPQFSFVASPAMNEDAKKSLISALIRLRPLERPEDSKTVRDWDDEIKNGFIRPSEQFLRDAIELAKVHDEITGEDR